MRKDFILPDEPEFDSDGAEPAAKRPVLPKNNYGRAIPKKEPQLSKKESKPQSGVGKDELLEDVDILRDARQKRERQKAETSTAKSTSDEEKKQDEIVRAMTRSRLAPVRRSRKSELPEETADESERLAAGHYKRVANALKRTRFALWIILALYVLASLLVYAEDITYENARLLFYDFQNAAAVSNADIVDTIRIPGDDRRYGTVFRGELCFASESGLRLLRTDGKQVLYDEKALYSPALSGSDKFMILYDRGHNNYSVYNSYSLILEQSTEFPIMHIGSADDGSYAILTRTREYRSSIEIYSPSFKLRQRIRTDSYVLFTAFSPDGKTLVTASLIPSFSEFDTVLTFYEIGQESAYASLTLESAFPYDMSFFGDGMTLLTSDCIYYIGSDGDILSSYPLDSKEISSFALDSSLACVYCADEASGGSVLIYDAENGSSRTLELSEPLSDIEFGEEKVFLLLESMILTFDIDSEETESYSVVYGAEMLLSLSDSVVCAVREDSIDCIHLD